MIRAVIFDMGGTLLRFPRPGDGSWRAFESIGIRGLYRYLIEQGHPIASQEDAFVDVMFERLADGWAQATGGQMNLRADQWIASVLGDHALVLDDTALMEAVAYYARPLRTDLAAMPGAQETLAALRAQGYRVGVISNTIWPAELHLEDLDTHGLLPYLEHTIFSGDAGIWKPRPEIFTHAMTAFGVTPAEAIFVGDSPREDILGAQQVGMRAVWQQNQEFPLGQVTPDAVIGTLRDLLPLVAQWQQE